MDWGGVRLDKSGKKDIIDVTGRGRALLIRKKPPPSGAGCYSLSYYMPFPVLSRKIPPSGEETAPAVGAYPRRTPGAPRKSLVEPAGADPGGLLYHAARPRRGRGQVWEEAALPRRGRPCRLLSSYEGSPAVVLFPRFGSGGCPAVFGPIHIEKEVQP